MSRADQAAASIIERLKAKNPKLERIESKTLGVLYLRKQTGADQLKIHAIQQEIGAAGVLSMPKSTFAAIFGSVMLRNEDGTAVFEDPHDGYRTLNELGATELNELYDDLMRVSGMGDRVLEDAEKKSSSDQTSEPGTN